LAEHSHDAIQIAILAPESRMQADWLTDCGRKRQKRILGPAICVTPASQPHSMEWDEAHGSILMIISPDLIMEEFPYDGRPLTIVQEQYGNNDPFVQHLADLLRNPSVASMPCQLQIESTAVVLLQHLSGRTESRRSLGSSSCGWLPRVIDYIYANLAAELSIVVLARVAQTSAFHFARKFKANIGVTPHQYVLEKRVEMARRLLLAPDSSIADVATSCGFATQAHLATVFRQTVGMTPKAYRTSAI